MKILVCVKQVLESELAVRPEPDGGHGPAVAARWRLNRFDEHAVEQGLRLAEADEGPGRVEAVTVGPERAREVLTRALGMGIEHGAHIRTPDGEPGDPAVTAGLLAGFAAGRGYDLILTGALSEDLMQGATGPMLAVALGLPWASLAVRLEWRGGAVYAEREIEGGRRQMMQLPLPALATVNTTARQPRYPTLSKLLKAKAAKLEIVQAEDLRPPQARLKIIEHVTPPASRKGEILQGSPARQAGELAARLRERGLLS